MPVDLVPRFRKLWTAKDESMERAAHLMTDRQPRDDIGSGAAPPKKAGWMRSRQKNQLTIMNPRGLRKPYSEARGRVGVLTSGPTPTYRPALTVMLSPAM